VGRGGVTAVSLGLSLITILQYVGQMLSALFFGIITKGGGILPRAAGQPIGDLAGWASATWVGLVIPGTIALICCFFIKPKPHLFNPEGGHAYGTSGPGDHGPGGHDLPGGH
jgi:TRAP-type C4-dicarboxylate transport system permease small subunit